MKTQLCKLIAALLLCTVATIPNMASATSVSGQGTWESTLLGRDLNGDGIFDAYYDTVLDITWLADANYAMTSNYDTDGQMSWANANAWAAGLTLGGYMEWRLPTITDNDGTVGGTTGELAHMFYITLVNNWDADGLEGWDLTNTGPFSNIQFLSGYYWTREQILDTGLGYFFSTYNQISSCNHDSCGNNPYAWAVHDGDVGVATPSAVPVPAAAWLFGSGLLGLVGMARRKAA